MNESKPNDMLGFVPQQAPTIFRSFNSGKGVIENGANYAIAVFV
ncbi:MAG: hypothetical protein QNJ51_27780 [Calothrix sp. MO_167.B12]|nr:hypothetical protein [Calothrix sp. MO_167.B12]